MMIDEEVKQTHRAHQEEYEILWPTSFGTEKSSSDSTKFGFCANCGGKFPEVSISLAHKHPEFEVPSSLWVYEQSMRLFLIPMHDSDYFDADMYEITDEWLYKRVFHWSKHWHVCDKCVKQWIRTAKVYVHDMGEYSPLRPKQEVTSPVSPYLSFHIQLQDGCDRSDWKSELGPNGETILYHTLSKNKYFIIPKSVAFTAIDNIASRNNIPNLQDYERLSSPWRQYIPQARKLFEKAPHVGIIWGPRVLGHMCPYGKDCPFITVQKEIAPRFQVLCPFMTMNEYHTQQQLSIRHLMEMYMSNKDILQCCAFANPNFYLIPPGPVETAKWCSPEDGLWTLLREYRSLVWSPQFLMAWKWE